MGIEIECRTRRDYWDHHIHMLPVLILRRLCLLVFACLILDSLKRLSLFLLTQCASISMFLFERDDFVTVFGCFTSLCTASALLLIPHMGYLKSLQFGVVRILFGIRVKNGDLGNGSGLNRCLSGSNCDSDSKVSSLHVLKNPNPKSNPNLKQLGEKKGVIGNEGRMIFNGGVKEIEEFEIEFRDDEQCCPEDEMFDVVSLRRLVKSERRRANAARLELEKDRMASSAAADEAMSMILRLQSEKGLVEVEANQFRRMAEQKQQYDHEVIESLRWIVSKLESDIGVLEDELRVHKKRLNFDLYTESNDNMEGIDEKDIGDESNVEENADNDGFLFSSYEFDESVSGSIQQCTR